MCKNFSTIQNKNKNTRDRILEVVVTIQTEHFRQLQTQVGAL